MTEKLHAAITGLRNRPWTAATSDMCRLDDGYATFVQTAKDKLCEPSIVVTPARNFRTLVPKCLHHSPALVIWLPPQLQYVMSVLPHVTPTAGDRTSPDLRRRDLVLSWTCAGQAFIAKASALKASMNRQAQEGAMPLIFASVAHTAISVLLLDDKLLNGLVTVGSRCGEHYSPEQEHTPEILQAAMKRKWARRTLADECIFQELRESDVVLRPRRAFRPDWIV